MLDFAPNLTWRYRVKYFSNGLNHHITLRTGEDSPSATGADLLLDALLATLDAFLPTDFALLDADECAPGSDIFVPSLPPVSSGITPSGTPSREAGANYLTFSGKGNDGTQFKFQLYGVVTEPSGVAGLDYRYQPGNNAAIDAAVNVLQNDGGWVQTTTVSGRFVQYRSYVNYGVSAYWQRKLR